MRSKIESDEFYCALDTNVCLAIHISCVIMAWSSLFHGEIMSQDKHKWMCPHCGYEAAGELDDRLCPTCNNLLLDVTLEKTGAGSKPASRRRAAFRFGAHTCIAGLVLSTISFLMVIPSDTHPAVGTAIFCCLAHLLIYWGLSDFYHLSQIYRPEFGFMMGLLLLRIPLLEYRVLYDPFFKSTILALLLLLSGMALIVGICHLASRLAKELGVGQGNLFSSLSWVLGTVYVLMIGPTVVPVGHALSEIYMPTMFAGVWVGIILLGITVVHLRKDRQKT
jgi:hypothetical protein